MCSHVLVSAAKWRLQSGIRHSSIGWKNSHPSRFRNLPEQISKLGGEGLSAKSLDPGMVASLLPHLLGTSPQREKVLKRPWDAEIQLSSYVLFDVQDKGGTRQTYTAEMAPGPWLDTKHETKKPPTWSRTIPLTPAPTDGELRFDEAKLMKLKELIAEAQKCFKAKFAFDRRMEESLILIRGRFNFDRLKAALDPIMNPVLLAPFGEEDVVEARIRGLASRPEWKSILEGDWKGEDRQTLLRNGLDRREMSFADLMKYPRVRERLNQLGLADREGKARLRLSLVIDVRIDDDASGFIID